MHTFTESGSGVPAFLAKLWRLVEDPETNNLIYWSKDGQSFIIQNQAQFARELLPLNYKHNNMASFIRQLNMYGFHKITSIENGGLKFDKDEMEFSHPCFKKGCSYLLDHIKRKIATQRISVDDRSGLKPESVNKVLSEVKLMRGRQDSLDSRFSVMKQENEALWREIASLRQKHMKQQQIVNKLIQFLVTIVQPSRNMSGVKRHFQLMINDAPQSSKIRKTNENNSGPVIHELTEELLDEVADSDAELLISSSPNVLSPPEHIDSDLIDEQNSINLERPQSTQSISSQFYDQNNDMIYCINEIPEDNVNVNVNEMNKQYFDENVLNTPLVQEEMARNQELQNLKEKINQKKIKTIKKQKGKEGGKKQTQNTVISQPHIKTENDDIDSLIFLDLTPNVQEETETTIDPTLLRINENISNNQQQPQNSKEIYSSDDFLNTDMPTNLFEEQSMIDNLNLDNDNFTNQINSSSNIPGGSEASSTRTSITQNTEKSIKKEDENNLTLAKYNNQKNPVNDDVMRLSTHEEFNSHLDNVQDDLDNLKDILRNEGYSLDANTLLSVSERKCPIDFLLDLFATNGETA